MIITQRIDGGSVGRASERPIRNSVSWGDYDVGKAGWLDWLAAWLAG